MNLFNNFAVALLLPLFLSASSPQEAKATLSLQDAKSSVIAKYLPGEWESDKDVTERLGKRHAKMQLSIKDDPSALEQLNKELPSKLVEAISEYPLWGVGHCTWRKDGVTIAESPYLLAEVKGNYYMVVFRERDGNPVGDSESGLVSFALGKDRTRDLLFMGGDFPNEPYRAFHRVQKQEQE